MIWPQKNPKSGQFWAIWNSTTSGKALKSPEVTFLNKGLATLVVYIVPGKVPATPDWGPQINQSGLLISDHQINLLKRRKFLSGSHHGPSSLAVGATFHLWPHSGLLGIDSPTPSKPISWKWQSMPMWLKRTLAASLSFYVLCSLGRKYLCLCSTNCVYVWGVLATKANLEI